jgi:single-stranded-DNA-specific exonuclease
VDVHLIDVAPELWRLFPSLENKSLLRLRSASRLARYGQTPPSEIDVFASLFTTYVQRKEEALQKDLESCLDLVAVSTLADMMPMRDENRILVKHGLRLMSTRARHGLRELLDRQRLLGKNLEAQDIGWSVSPIINAAGRMGEPDKAVKLLLTEDEQERSALAEQVFALNARRRQVGEEAWQTVQGQAQESFDAHQGRFVLVSSDTIHRGVTGIIAGRLARQFRAPAAVVTIMDDRAVGSVRAARGLVATELLKQCDDIFLDWGGHDAAAGFHLEPGRLPELEQRLNELVKSVSLDETTEDTVEVDAELPLDFLTPELADVVKIFAPFGQENPRLIFLARGLVLQDVSIIGKKGEHLRLLLDAGRNKWPAVYWQSAEKVGAEFTKGDRVDVVFHLGTNFYQSRESQQLTVLDMTRTAQ